MIGLIVVTLGLVLTAALAVRARGVGRVLLGLVATLLLAEGLARALVAARPPYVEQVPSRSTDQGLAPLADLQIPERLTTTPERRPRRGTPRRVLLVGDSFAAGQGVGPGEDLAAHLTRQWSQKGQDVEVIVRAHPALGVWTERLWWWDDGAWWSPDLVIWVWVLNDLRGSNPWIQRPLGMTAQDWNDLILDRSVLGAGSPSALWDLGRQAWSARRLGPWVAQVYARGHDPAHNGRELDAVETTFREIADHLAARDARLVVAVHPLLHQLDAYPWQAAHDEVLRRARRAGAEGVDLLDVFRGDDPRDLWVHPADHHPDAAAHARSAAALVDALGPVTRAGPLACDTVPGAGADAALWRQRCADPEDPAPIWELAARRAAHEGHPDDSDVAWDWLTRVLVHAAVGTTRLQGASVDAARLQSAARLAQPPD